MLRRAMMAATSGPPPVPGTAPDQIANLTFWYDGDNSPQWKTSGTAGGASTANGDPMQRADSLPTSIARCFANGGGVRNVPVVGSSSGFTIGDLASPGAMHFWARPTGTGNPATATPASQLLGANAKTILMAVRVNDASTGPAQSFLLQDGNDYFSVGVHRSGSNAIFRVHNYAAGYQERTATVTGGIGQWVVVGMTHGSSQLRIWINGAQVGTAVASGATDLMTNQPFLAAYLAASYQNLATYNRAITAPEMLEVSRWMGSRVGLTI